MGGDTMAASPACRAVYLGEQVDSRLLSENVGFPLATIPALAPRRVRNVYRLYLQGDERRPGLLWTHAFSLLFIQVKTFFTSHFSLLLLL
jgi:hypothetical protein